jgi:outer membrane protein assembly factor BamB
MMGRQHALSIALVSVLAGTMAFGQVGRGGSEWLTAFADAQRTSWIRTDAKISVETMSKPGFELQWTSKLDNRSRQLNGLSAGVTANGVTLFVPMSVVTGSSNNVYAIDNDTGYVVWKRTFEAPMPAPTAACAGGITSAATRIVNVAPATVTAPPPPRGGGAGRGPAGYRSVVGEPGQGVPIETRGGGPGRGGPPAGGLGAAAGRTTGPAGAPPAAPGAPAPAAPANPSPGPAPPPAPAIAGAPGAPAPAAPGRVGAPGPGQGGGRGNQGNAGIPGAPGGGGPGGGFGRPSGVVYAVASDGMLHVLGLPSGKDIQRPAPFLPANARWSEPIAVGTMLYAATAGNCGGAPNGIYAVDLESETKPVVSWRTNGGSVVGAIAFGSDGTVFAAVGPGQVTGDGKANAIVALDAKTLQIKDWFAQPAAEFVTGPTIFRHNEKEIVAAGTRDGRVLLLDAAFLGGSAHATPLLASGVAAAGGSVAGTVATWQEAMIAPAPPAAAGAPPAPATVTMGARWLLVPVNGRVAGTVATNGAFSSGGVVALKVTEAAGKIALEPGWTSHNLTAPATPITVNGVVFALSTGRPATASGTGTPAVLHAYDGRTGKPLWTSGKVMTSFASPGSFWSAMGQAYVGTHDGTLYAFGFLDERR